MYKFKSTGVIFSKSACIEFFNAIDEDNAVIVINSIKHITLILITVVLILLCNCLSTNILVPFKYVLFLAWTNLNINPEKDQNIKIVPTTPSKTDIPIALVVSLTFVMLKIPFVTSQ